MPEERKQQLVEMLGAEKTNSAERMELARLILLDPAKPKLNNSAANRGVLGILNRWSQGRREKAYRAKKNGFQGTVIVSEGDSWFQFPWFVKDIIDWLMDEPKYNILSLGSGGDWLANMVEKQQHLEAIEAEHPRPHVFLISGGGNDLADDSRVAKLVHPFSEEREEEPRKYLNEDYYCVLEVFEQQYVQLFAEVGRRCPGLKIITHGYAYAIPSSKKGRFPVQWLVNFFSRTGKWLKRPLEMRGITNPKTQRKIVRHMIDDFNAMLERAGSSFPHVHHVDSRGLFKADDWYNELHLEPAAFKVVAELYIKKINNLPGIAAHSGS